MPGIHPRTELLTMPGSGTAPSPPAQFCFLFFFFPFHALASPHIFKEDRFKMPLICWALEGASRWRISGLLRALLVVAEERLVRMCVQSGFIHLVSLFIWVVGR